MKTKLLAKLIENFKIPAELSEESLKVIDQMLSPREQHLVSFMKPGVSYSKEELGKFMEEAETSYKCLSAECKEDQKPDPADEVSGAKNSKENGTDFGGDFTIENLYHRGVINLCEDEKHYELNTFLSRLDIFSTEEYETYSAIDENIRNGLDELYFQDYVNWIKSIEGDYPTDDEVLPMQDVFEFIDAQEAKGLQAYRANCDCRSLAQKCDAPRDVCITYRTAVRSYVRRGLAEPITARQAKSIVRKADKQGLIHTINSGGICSCCHDCCYLFRSQEAIGSQGVWPKVSYQVVLDQSKCVGCGICIKRCRFNVFSMVNAEPADKASGTMIRYRYVAADTSKCQGCGLCVSTCGIDALTLKKL